MTPQEWEELNVGDVLYNKTVDQAYVVSDATMSEEKTYSLTRTVIARNPAEWERVRKTVSVNESNS